MVVWRGASEAGRRSSPAEGLFPGLLEVVAGAVPSGTMELGSVGLLSWPVMLQLAVPLLLRLLAPSAASSSCFCEKRPKKQSHNLEHSFTVNVWRAQLAERGESSLGGLFRRLRKRRGKKDQRLQIEV